MTFNEFIKKYNLRKEATSNIKIQQVLCSIGLNYFGIYLRDGSFSSDNGIVNLHPSKGTHWVCYINEIILIVTVVCPKKLSKFIIKRNGYCLYSEYQLQKIDSFCARYCLYIIYLTKIVGIDFKSSVLNCIIKEFPNIKKNGLLVDSLILNE